VVPYTVATDMDSPNPDTGEEYPHTNTQLFNILNEANRFRLGAETSGPYNAPEPGQTPTMDGFVTDYINTLTAELGRQPTYEEYWQVMTGFVPGQIPVLSGLARGFGVFDHLLCEVPSQTFPNRSFWTAATASGFVVNSPVKNWMQNTAERSSTGLSSTARRGRCTSASRTGSQPLSNNRGFDRVVRRPVVVTRSDWRLGAQVAGDQDEPETHDPTRLREPPSGPRRAALGLDDAR